MAAGEHDVLAGRKGLEFASKQRPVSYGSQFNAVLIGIAAFILSGWLLAGWVIVFTVLAGLYLLITGSMCGMTKDEMLACKYRVFPDNDEDIRWNKEGYYHSLCIIAQGKAEQCEKLKHRFDAEKESHHIELLNIQINACGEEVKMYQLSIENLRNEARDREFMGLTGENSSHTITY